jgi:DMSO/TMAO reductase YedYZ molybdopterin-dependent catalytic subunit
MPGDAGGVAMVDLNPPTPVGITRRALLWGAAIAGAIPPALLADAARARDPAAWRLRVGGRVSTPFELSLIDLQRLGGEHVAAVLECGDSGRVRAAGWTGVPLARVLDLLGIGGEAVAVIARGSDGHRRAIPLRDVRPASPLLVWATDGEALPRSHGGPVRLLVPGWAGEASVKGLVGLDLVDRMSADPGPSDPADRRLRPLREMPPRAIIVDPADGQAVRAGRQVVRGHAWSGYAPVETVAVTVDGGATWREAEIVERAGPLGGVGFSVGWDARPGPATLAARATDTFGHAQPLDVPDRSPGFVHNAVRAVPVIVAR